MASINISMNIIKRTDIIPILYMGGTGGSFLSAFIRAARDNIQNNQWLLSKYGNAHSCPVDPRHGCWGGTFNFPTLTYLLGEYYSPASTFTRYTASHCPDPAAALTYFDKVIKTYVAPADSREVALVFAVKYFLDVKSYPEETPVIRDVVNSAAGIFSNFPALCNESDLPNILNISWTDILYSSPDILINKLSDFTNIPRHQFPVNFLLDWRNRTLTGIEKFKDCL